MSESISQANVVKRSGPAQGDDTALVYRHVIQNIRAGAYTVGARLPTERKLAEAHGVSRNTVRNALSMLQSQGIVERRVGDGTYLSGKALERLQEEKPVAQHHDAVPSFMELLEGRLLFEAEMMGLVAKRADEADFLAMTQQLKKMREAKEWIEFKECLYGVHLAIYRATKNRFLIQVFENIIANRRAVDYDGGSEAHSQVSELVREQSAREVQEIVDALMRRDAHLATKKAHQYFMRILSSVAVYS